MNAVRTEVEGARLRETRIAKTDSTFEYGSLPVVALSLVYLENRRIFA